jgi:GT2 family glycosyltransferase
MIKVSVVILNWNGVDFLQKFLPGVIQHSHLKDVEIIVADNNSSDTSVTVLQQNFPGVRLIQFDKNYGFAGGYNKALEQIKAQYYILLNSDVEVTENWIEPIVDYLDKNPEVAAAMPKLKAFHDKESFEYAGAAGGFIDKNGYPFCRGRIFNTVEKDYGQYDDLCEVFWATGACMFVRADLFHQAGGFDAEFFAHMEEIDLCWRFKWMGYKIVYHPEVTVYHVGGGALPKENPYKTYLNFRNNLFLLYKNLPSEKLQKVLLSRFLLDIVAVIKFIVDIKLKHSWAIIRAYSNFYHKLSYLKKCRSSVELLQVKNSNDFGVFKKNILLEYYIKRKKTFSLILKSEVDK